MMSYPNHLNSKILDYPNQIYVHIDSAQYYGGYDSKNDIAHIPWARPTSFILQEHCRIYRQRLAA
jgi:hypothetical protein